MARPGTATAARGAGAEQSGARCGALGPRGTEPDVGHWDRGRPARMLKFKCQNASVGGSESDGAPPAPLEDAGALRRPRSCDRSVAHAVKISMRAGRPRSQCPTPGSVLLGPGAPHRAPFCSVLVPHTGLRSVRPHASQPPEPPEDSLRPQLRSTSFPSRSTTQASSPYSESSIFSKALQPSQDFKHGGDSLHRTSGVGRR